MRLSTGIILSILSANVFAIEHPNGAHSGSLLARRAVVADADSPFLQKRGNDKDQKKQKKQKDQKKPEEQKQEKPEEQKQEKHVGSKTYYPFNSGPANCVYIKGELDEDFYLNPNFSDDTGEGTTDSPTYDPNQDLGATGGKEDAHTDDDSDQEGSSLTDASRGSSSQVFGRIRKELYRVKYGLGLLYRLERAFAAFDEVLHHFGGHKGHTIGWNAFRMHQYALKKSREYEILYRDPAKSPFILKLPSSASNEQRKTYKRLQKEVHKSSKNHISAIVHAVDRTFVRPGSVLSELEDMMKTIDSVYKSILNIRSEYSKLLEELGMSGSGHLANFDYHMTVLGVYKCNLYGRLYITRAFFEAYTKTPKPGGLIIRSGI
ncbi:hypothetical protein BASA62_002369 [Batrachochytrium salamandrivorans]|nr:hypothetical protein BASA62_002369 [Batrachochytrium salamandrivorans]